MRVPGTYRRCKQCNATIPMRVVCLLLSFALFWGCFAELKKKEENIVESYTIEKYLVFSSFYSFKYRQLVFLATMLSIRTGYLLQIAQIALR